MYLAIINTPGYVSEQDELPEFETMAQAWEYLRSERQRDLDYVDYDEPEFDEDQCIEELDGMIDNPELGTVYGRTLGYDGDHDLGVAYSVVRSEMSAKQVMRDSVDPIQAWATETNKPFDLPEQPQVTLSPDQIKARDYAPSWQVRHLVTLYAELGRDRRDWWMSDREAGHNTGTRHGVAMALRSLVREESHVSDPDILDAMTGDMITEALINKA